MEYEYVKEEYDLVNGEYSLTLIESKVVNELFKEKYIAACDFFKSLGGYEKLEKMKNVTIVTSISPNKEHKVVAKFLKSE